MRDQKRTILSHVLIPIVPTIVFFINAGLPVTVLGCANRGWVAFIVALVSLLVALYTVAIAVKMRFRNEPDSGWWVISTLILMIPALALLIFG